MPVMTAASTPMSRAGVAPKKKSASGWSGKALTTAEDTNQPANAAAIIMPSMPMLTTPERSFMKPQYAPSAMGAASARMTAPLSVNTRIM